MVFVGIDRLTVGRYCMNNNCSGMHKHYLKEATKQASLLHSLMLLTCYRIIYVLRIKRCMHVPLTVLSTPLHVSQALPLSSYMC